MSQVSGASLVAKQLRVMGIDTIFTVLGGPMIDVLAQASNEGIKVINCRHEMNAAFAAAAWGYINQKPGIMVAASGPAMTNTITPMYVSTKSAMPLVILGGSAAEGTLGLGSFQELDQTSFANPAAKWVQRVDTTEHIPELLYLAFGKAQSGRPGAAYLDFPGNILSDTIDSNNIELREKNPNILSPQPNPIAIKDVANMLTTAERPLVIIGKGAAWSDASLALTDLVDRGIPFIASPMGRGVVPDDHELNMGAARSKAMSEADAILMVGGRFNWVFQLGKRFKSNAKIAQIDIQADEFFSAAKIDIGIIADANTGIQALNEAMNKVNMLEKNNTWIEDLFTKCKENEATIQEQTVSNQEPINHYRLLADIRDSVERDAIVTEDGELTMAIARQIMPTHIARHRLGAGTTGCMGTGLPYALGAKLAKPDRQVIAILGDYAFGAAAMEVETCARWNIPIVIIVSNNAGIAAHTIQDRSFSEDAPPIAALLPIHYEKMVEMVGGYSERVTNPDEIKPAITRALASGKVSLLNVITDPKAQRRGGGYL